MNKHGSKPLNNLRNLRETLNLRETCPIAIIAAMDRNRVIGKAGKMPWNLPEDLQWFKSHTLGHPVLMGRKTFESLPSPLPGRQNIVLSHDPDFAVPQGVWRFDSAQAAELIVNASFDHQHQILFVIGGAELFRFYMPRADYLYLSEIDAEYEGDTYFPEFDPQSWRIIHDERVISQSGIAIRFRILTKHHCY